MPRGALRQGPRLTDGNKPLRCPRRRQPGRCMAGLFGWICALTASEGLAPSRQETRTFRWGIRTVLRSPALRQGKRHDKRSARTPDSGTGPPPTRRKHSVSYCFGNGPGSGRPPPAPPSPRPAPSAGCRPARTGAAENGCSQAERVPWVPACAGCPQLGHAGVAPSSEEVSAGRLPPPVCPKTGKAMTAAPQGPDLSFLNEEEARAIFQVLQRDAELRRAEKDRIRYWAAKVWVEGAGLGSAKLTVMSGSRGGGRGVAPGGGTAGSPRPPVSGTCGFGTFGERRIVAGTALSHGCCSPWLSPFFEEEAASAFHRAAGRD